VAPPIEAGPAASAEWSIPAGTAHLLPVAEVNGPTTQPTTTPLVKVVWTAAPRTRTSEQSRPLGKPGLALEGEVSAILGAGRVADPWDAVDTGPPLLP